MLRIRFCGKYGAIFLGAANPERIDKVQEVRHGLVFDF
jgi:hypothetical protein